MLDTLFTQHSQLCLYSRRKAGLIGTDAGWEKKFKMADNIPGGHGS